MRTLRKVLVVLVALALTVVAGVGIRYRDQIYRYATHRKGGPAVTTPWAPVGGPGGAPELHLAVVGDVGDAGSRLDLIASAVAKVDGRAAFDGLVVLGDDAYPSGDPNELDSTVFGPFAPVLDRGAELFAVLGNHDVMHGNGPAVAAALGMPGRWWAAHLGDVLLVGLDSNQPDDPRQMAWLERTLATANEPWRIVALHHPPYSSGYHGSNGEVQAAFAPLFERYGVQLVLSGHEHDYQRSVPIDGTTYVVSGGASGSRGTGEEAFTAAAYGWLHFVELSLFPDRIVVRAIGADLGVGDEASIPSGRRAASTP